MLNRIKVVWLCNYSLVYLKDRLNLKMDFSSTHPVPWLYYLADEISKRKDIDLHIITLKNNINRDYHLVEGNISYHIISEWPSGLPRIGVNHLLMYGHRMIKIGWKRKIVNLVKKLNPDIINVHGTEGELQLLVNELNYPALVWMQGMMNDVTKIQQNKKYLRWLDNENQILQKQKCFIAFPGDMQNKIRRINPDAQMYALYHPNPEYAFNLFGNNLRIDADLIYASEIVKRKGIEDFILAIDIIKKSIPEIKGKIVGFIGDKEYYKQIIDKINSRKLDENIRMLGFLNSHSDVLREIKKSKIFILPTYVDTGPRSVAESMTVGVPVISYNIDGLPEMINSGIDGILVEKGNISALANAIVDLLQDEHLRRSIAKNAFKVAKEKYSAQQVVDRLTEIYKKTITEYQNDSLIPNAQQQICSTH